MTADQLVQHLGQCRRKIKALRDDNQRLWDSREEWKQKHREREAEITHLRRRITRLTESRNLWRVRAEKYNVLLYNKRRRKPKPNCDPAVRLQPGDLERILEMPARD